MVAMYHDAIAMKEGSVVAEEGVNYAKSNLEVEEDGAGGGAEDSAKFATIPPPLPLPTLPFVTFTEMQLQVFNVGLLQNMHGSISHKTLFCCTFADPNPQNSETRFR